MKPIVPKDQQSVPNVLIVDDTPANLKLLAEMLKRSGYKARPVPSGKLAIQAVQNERPDLILLDINMPEMNGYEVCAQLKADAASKDIPIIFISALDETTDKTRAFAAGGVDYVTKPFQFEEVESRVQTHLKLRRLQAELETQNLLLQERYDQLKQLDELQDNLTHMVVHDMRSPLMGIMGNLELLDMNSDKKLNHKELAPLKNARSAALVLAGMVTSLLDISRMEQGQMPLDMTTTDLDVLIQSAFNSLGCLTKKVKLIHQKRSLPVTINCDANLIARVIANLVGNAVKFTPEGGNVTVFAQRNEAEAKLSVADTGSGIPRKFHQRIFEKFGQVEARQQREVHSSGLGLTFCKLAAEAHGGRVGVESTVGEGSVFWFTLPMRYP